MSTRTALVRRSSPLDPSAALDVATKQYVDSKSQAVYSGTVPSGSTTATITHNLGTTNVDVTVRDSSGNEVQVPNRAATANTVVLTFTAAPTANQYTVTVQGGVISQAGLSSSTPSPVASTASAGTSAFAARADHVHAPQAPVTLSYAATIATDASLSSMFRVTLTGNATLGAPTNPADGQRVIWQLTASGGSWTVTPATGTAGSFAFGSDITSLTAIASGKSDYLEAIYNAAAQRWHIVASAKGY